MKLPLSLLLALSLAAARGGAEEPARPFLFTTVAPTEERGWVAHYDAGYSERADATVVSAVGGPRALVPRYRAGDGRPIVSVRHRLVMR